MMAVEARPHFCVDPAHRQSYREDRRCHRHPSAVRQTRSAAANALRAKLSAPSTTNRLIAHILCNQRVRLQVTRFGAGVTPHPRSSSRRADTMSARFEHTPPHHETSASSSQGCSWYVEHADPRPEPISIARCRELLGKDAEDEAFLFERSIDIETYDRHAEKLREELTLARIDRHSGQLDELDVEGVLAFAERVLRAPPTCGCTHHSNSGSGSNNCFFQTESRSAEKDSIKPA